ncbi:MAG: glycosyl hydrolase, partial [Myxococcota bacterium]|nr:glycosyl hydrolase [Myxococcota bacterium]
NNPDEIRAFLETHREVRYLLGYNEPNFQEQANMTPAYAASLWPTFEAIAEEYDLELVGPAVNYCGGCVLVDGRPIESDYIVWLDLFLAAYREQFGREARIDYHALHWYDFGLPEQVERLIERYDRPVWVTEFALWRHEEWNTDEFERDWLLETVHFLEAHPLVHRYSWFTGRRGDFPRINLLGAEGELTALGRAYVEAPFSEGD